MTNDTDTEAVRTAVASVVLAGDLQELLNLYAGGDVAAEPEEIARLYDEEALTVEEREELAEVRAAISDELLPEPGERTTVPAEMVELTARCALERGKLEPALSAIQEANALDRFCELYASFGVESLEAGDDARAAYELAIAGRLGWARMSAQERVEFLAGLGVDLGELAGTLGAESSRGRFSGGRGLPDFPAWQTYGSLLHARCGAEGCISDRPPEALAPVAVRLLLHDPQVAERALAAAGDPMRLLRALARELDPELPAYAERYARAMERYSRLHEGKLIRDPRLEQREGKDAEGDAEASEEPEEETSESARAEAAREGLQEVQSILLGHHEGNWRNCLAALSAKHPLSVFTVCAVRSRDLGGFVIPVGQAGEEFLRAVK